jgi:Effector Associated Constant Component 1
VFGGPQRTHTQLRATRLICVPDLPMLGDGGSTRATIVPGKSQGEGMDVRISLVGEKSAADLESLDDWLSGEPELAGRVKLAAPVPREGELGALVEVLVAAVSSGGTLSVLATSLHAWLSQPRRPHIVIRVEDETGRAVEIDADRVNARQAEAMLRRALDFGRSEE